MSEIMHRCAVVFGGFRTTTLVGSRAVVTTLKALNVDGVDHENLWSGHGDSLETRYHRAVNWLSSQTSGSVELHILGHSMGCHMAVKFAHLALMSTPASWRLGQLILSAPDPKYRRGPWDLIEERAGTTQAYDEARKLWNNESAAGAQFTDTLGLVSSALQDGCRVIYCKSDKVALWRQNVEITKSVLNSCSAIKWVEALPDALVDLHGIQVSLRADDIAHIEEANQYHEILWLCSKVN